MVRSRPKRPRHEKVPKTEAEPKIGADEGQGSGLDKVAMLWRAARITGGSQKLLNMKSYASLTFKVVSFIISPLGEERFGKKRTERSHHQSRNTSIHPEITNPCQFVFTRSPSQYTFG